MFIWFLIKKMLYVGICPGVIIGGSPSFGWDCEWRGRRREVDDDAVAPDTDNSRILVAFEFWIEKFFALENKPARFSVPPPCIKCNQRSGISNSIVILFVIPSNSGYVLFERKWNSWLTSSEHLSKATHKMKIKNEINVKFLANILKHSIPRL